MTDQVQKILKVANSADVTELTVMHNARINTLNAYNDKPTAVHKKDYDAANEGLQLLVEQLSQKHNIGAPRLAVATQQPASDTADTLFKNSTEMFEYLKEKGWGIGSRQTLTNHAKNGTLQLQGDRSITSDAFNRWKTNPDGGAKYYENYIKQKREAYGTVEENALVKSRAETDIAIEKAKMMKFDREKKEGKYLPRDDFELELAGRAGVLDSRLDYMFNTEAANLIALVGGDQAKRTELISSLRLIKNTLLNEFATIQTFQVMAMDDDGDDDCEIDDYLDEVAE